MVSDGSLNNIDTNSLNESVVESSSITNESVNEPDFDIDDSHIINAIDPTILRAPESFDAKEEEIRRQSRYERTQFATEKLLANEKLRTEGRIKPYPTLPETSHGKVEFIRQYLRENAPQSKSEFIRSSSYNGTFGIGNGRVSGESNRPNSGQQYGSNVPYGGGDAPQVQSRSAWEENFIPRRPGSSPAGDNLTPGDYLAPTRAHSGINSAHHAQDEGFNRMPSMTRTRSNNVSWNDIPLITTIATPVPTIEENDNHSKESREVVKKAICLQKILLAITFVLIAIASGAAVYASRVGGFSSGNGTSTASSNVNPPTTIIIPPEITSHVPSNHPSISPTLNPITTQLLTPTNTNQPTIFPSSSITYSPTNIHSPLPSIKPSEIPSNPPSIALSSSPTTFKTQPPSHQPISTKSPTHFPTAKPTKGCESWCANHVVPWTDPDPKADQKCRWPVTCGGCPQCVKPNPSLAPTMLGCEKWCPNHPVPWYDPDPDANQKCKWHDRCAKCLPCSDPLVNPGH